MSSFGEELKRERELREITLREVSEATKVNLRYLDALERNDFERLPGGVFNKGFVRAYAEYIGVDPETMVNAYLLEERDQQSERVGGLSDEVFRPSRDSAIPPAPATGGADDRSRAALRTAAVAIALGLAAVVVALLAWWWWAGRESSAESEAPVETPVVTETAEEVLPPAPESGGPGEEAPDEGPVIPAETAGPGPARTEPEPEPPSESEEMPAASRAGAGVPQVRVVLARATQGRLNCDNRRVEILDGMAAGTAMVFRCREFLLVDALDGGAVLVQPEGAGATPLGPDGLPVVGRYIVPEKARPGAGEP